MLHECYGGRKANRTFLQTGRLGDIRLPTLNRTHPEEGRRLERSPRARPNAGVRRQKYFSMGGRQAPPPAAKQRTGGAGGPGSWRFCGCRRRVAAEHRDPGAGWGGLLA